MEPTMDEKKMTLNRAVLELFLTNPRRTTGEISKVGGRCHTARISTLRKFGYVIEIVGEQGEDKVYEYRGFKLDGPRKLNLKKTRDKHPKPSENPGFTLELLGHDTCPTCHGTGSVPTERKV